MQLKAKATRLFVYVEFYSFIRLCGMVHLQHFETLEFWELWELWNLFKE